MRPGPALIAVLLATLAGATAPGRAHDPTLHGFPVVVFERPFRAPDFSAESLAGGATDLASLRGRHVLLNFWATWCPPCLEEMPSMDTLQRGFRARGLVVVAVSSDREGAAVVRPFIERLGVGFTVLLDPDGSIAARYGARNLPVSFLLDPEGRVVAATQGARDWASAEAYSVIAELLEGP